MGDSNSIPSVPLNPGNAIPFLGFGTATYPFTSGPVKKAVIKAIEVGYRHFDTASMYQSEEPLGEAIREALKMGIINSREDLFISSKLWSSDAHHHLVAQALQNTLRNLGLEYLDLYLIHWPLSSNHGRYEMYMGKEEMMPMDFGAVWKAMEECQKLGLAKSIGVSNFSCKKLQTILDVATIPPVVNQVGGDEPVLATKEVERVVQRKEGTHRGMVNTFVAWSILGSKGTPWGTNRVMDSDTLQNIAQEKGKTLAQVCLRWAYEQGVSVVVKSLNEERMKENVDIYGWKLSDEDYRRIEEIPQVRGFPYLEITGEGTTPYKTVDDLWDGEI